MNSAACKFFFSLCLALTLVSCADKPCREPRRPELDRTSDPENLEAQKPLEKNPGRIWVSRTEGSLQCQPGTGKSLADSAAELSGIVVYKKLARLDGLMRVQMCGTPTGRLHVFEIDAGRLADAEKRGFVIFNSDK